MSAYNALIRATDESRSNEPVYPITQDINVKIKSRNTYSRNYQSLDALIDALSDFAFLSSVSVSYDSVTDTVEFS